MALVTCRECGAQSNSSARSCQTCKRALPPRRGAAWIGLGVAVLAGVLALAWRQYGG